MVELREHPFFTELTGPTTNDHYVSIIWKEKTCLHSFEGKKKQKVD